MQVSTSFSACIPSFPAPGNDRLPHKNYLWYITFTMQINNLNVCALNHKQLDLLIPQLSLLSQGSEVHPTPAHTICILFNVGEIQ